MKWRGGRRGGTVIDRRANTESRRNAAEATYHMAQIRLNNGGGIVPAMRGPDLINKKKKKNG